MIIKFVLKIHKCTSQKIKESPIVRYKHVLDFLERHQIIDPYIKITSSLRFLKEPQPMVLWFWFFSNNWNRGKWIQITTQHWFRLVWGGGCLKKFRIKEAPVLGIKIISQSNNHRIWVFWEKKTDSKNRQFQIFKKWLWTTEFHERTNKWPGGFRQMFDFFKRIENCDYIQ